MSQLRATPPPIGYALALIASQPVIAYALPGQPVKFLKPKLKALK